MKPALYLFVNKGLGMSGGKIAAQVAQATVGAWHESMYQSLHLDWWAGPGHHHTTYVMEARDALHLWTIEAYLNHRGFKTYMMIDEGMTEVPPLTPTVLAVEIVDKDDPHVEASFMTFKLYKDKKPEGVNPGKGSGHTMKRRFWGTTR